MKTPDRYTFVKLTLYSFFIRIFYNYKYLFGSGIKIMLEGYINELSPEKVYGTEEDLEKMFNTNEYLSGFAIGIHLKYISENETGKLIKIRPVISSTLGAVGDNLFQGHIIPVTVLAVLNMSAISGYTLKLPVAVSVTLFILLFTFINTGLRYYGIKKGFEEGTSSLKIFKSRTYLRTLIILKYAKYIFGSLLGATVFINDGISYFPEYLKYLVPGIVILFLIRTTRFIDTEKAAFLFLLSALTISCFF